MKVINSPWRNHMLQVFQMVQILGPILLVKYFILLSSFVLSSPVNICLLLDLFCHLVNFVIIFVCFLSYFIQIVIISDQIPCSKQSPAFQDWDWAKNRNYFIFFVLDFDEIKTSQGSFNLVDLFNAFIFSWEKKKYLKGDLKN